MTEHEPAPASRSGQAPEAPSVGSHAVPEAPSAGSHAVPEAPQLPMSRWGRRASGIYLVVCALALLAMLVETLIGRPGMGSMFAAILAAPWSMLVAGFAPPLPSDWPMAAGLAVRMVPLALFMLLNAAIVRGIAARSERDLARAATRVSALLLLAAPLGSGCMLSTRQEVFVAMPTFSLLLLDGGKQEMVFRFDLASSPQWVQQHNKILRVTDLAILGDFRNATGGGGGLPVPIDVKVGVVDPTPPSYGDGTVIWGPVHIGTATSQSIDWAAGRRLMLADAPALQSQIRGDGAFELYTVTTPQITLNGGVSIENLQLAAVFELK